MEYVMEYVIEKDSVWMLESMIEQTRDEIHCFETIRNSYFDLALKSKSIFMLKYFMALFWECIVHSVIVNYKIEFKYSFDLYTSRFHVKDFQPCSIQSDEAYYFIGAKYVKREIYWPLNM